MPTWEEVFTDSYVIYDTETSGLHPEEGDRIIEAGIMEVDDNVVRSVSNWIINPLFPEPFHIPDKVVELTGINDTELSYGADPKEFYPSLMNRLRFKHIWGHNIIRFDQIMLDEECKRLCILSLPKQNLFDSAAIFKAWQLSLPDKPWTREPYILDKLEDYDTFYDWGTMVLEKRIRGLKYNLGFCCETLGVDVSDIRFHRAGNDVTATYRLINALKKIILE